MSYPHGIPDAFDLDLDAIELRSRGQNNRRDTLVLIQRIKELEAGLKAANAVCEAEYKAELQAKHDAQRRENIP